MGNWTPVDKLIAIEIEEIDCKKSPNCHSIVAEIMRGAEAVRSKALVIADTEFPAKVGCKRLTMVSKFYTAGQKIQDKTLEFRISALTPAMYGEDSATYSPEEKKNPQMMGADPSTWSPSE
jgi:hypothetical protein